MKFKPENIIYRWRPTDSEKTDTTPDEIIVLKMKGLGGVIVFGKYDDSDDPKSHLYMKDRIESPTIYRHLVRHLISRVECLE